MADDTRREFEMSWDDSLGVWHAYDGPLAFPLPEGVKTREEKPGDIWLSESEYNRISIGLENLEISAPLKLRGEIRKLRGILERKMEPKSSTEHPSQRTD